MGAPPPTSVFVGKTFGRLTVAADSGVRNKGYRLWVCKCICGGKTVSTERLQTGRTRSCGCLLREIARAHGRKYALASGMAARNALFAQYRRGAHARGLQFDITEELAFSLFASTCYYCGTAPATIHKGATLNGTFTFNGIDRLQNEYGYIDSNVVPCCKFCNLRKSSVNHDEFVAWVRTVARNLDEAGMNRRKLKVVGR